MISGKHVLALIPARGGSKRLPLKNIRPIAGKPLLCWSIDAARDCEFIDHVVVSTDCPTTALVARGYDCAVLDRPAAISGDGVPTEAAVAHAAALFPKFALIVVLQPTSPLRAPGGLLACILGASAGQRAWTVRMDWSPSGDVYVVPADLIGEPLTAEPGFRVPSESVDIDTVEDFAAAESLLLARKD